MAVAQAITRAPETEGGAGVRPSWNPLRCGGTALPPAVLMFAKLTALGLVALGYVQRVRPPHLPLMGWPYGLPGEPTQRVLQAVMLGAVALLLFNRLVRTCCVALAAVLVSAILIERTVYTNAQVFGALLLLFIGLYEGGVTHLLLRWQLALMYFGAFLNKLLDADWRSGVFFDYLIADAHRFGPYVWLAGRLPEGALGVAFSWATIATELTLALLFALPRAPRAWLAAVALGVAFHGGSVVMTGTIFGIYVPAVVFAYILAFPTPRAGEATLHAPADSRLARLVRRLDLDGVYRIDRTGAPRLTLSVHGRTLRGLVARAATLAWLPMTWLVLAVLLAVLRQAKVWLVG